MKGNKLIMKSNFKSFNEADNKVLKYAYLV
jgi:hypothetical protein